VVREATGDISGRRMHWITSLGRDISDKKSKTVKQTRIKTISKSLSFANMVATVQFFLLIMPQARKRKLKQDT